MSLSPLATQTPGVYIDEVNAFPNSVVEVATAVPAFIGYTPNAAYEGKSYLNKPVKITSMNEFQAFFMVPNPPAPAPAAKQYFPEYYITKQKKMPEKGHAYHINGDIYTVEPDPGTIYYLYNSIRLFFENGGGSAYIVSVGPYGTPTKSPVTPGDQIVNPNVKLSDLMGGVELLKKIEEVTMYVVPEATLLTPDDNSTLMEAMLLQNGDMGTAMSLLDIIGGNNPDPILYTQDIQNFRNSTGMNSLKYGAAYYPFLNTTITEIGEIDYGNINGGDVSALADIVNPPAAPNASAEQILGNIKSPPAGMTSSQLNQALMNSSKQYKQIMGIIQEQINTLPPSGAMAGVYTQVDNTKGVWNAPANVTPVGAVGLTLNINDSMQAGLNVDAVSGKSINAIRFFNGLGILVWGARTLDGNSDDWRYINVRRTVTMIEQSVKLASHPFVFAPNDANTWQTVKSMIENFLENIWKEGALQGSTPTDAFNVAVGLGTTMTAQDILEGTMKIAVKIAVTHPAEFIVIEVEQEMAKS
ncbi:MAG: phage tail sheath C-terminal domain-containing protein [Reichenbachiella sp.]|uniref:phage tail sheath family protein n=1 Tax=Reichenbachiella sp. TaxID=2184521 RepID=UPI00296665AD|nr:phage tail sheath C-terminal domain-containing protein [Reichenbachiella sp.]MDW3211154.1 phage tail sheath C-terminal domain-containing protein [Reichenbachiella sp.]